MCSVTSAHETDRRVSWTECELVKHKGKMEICLILRVNGNCLNERFCCAFICCRRSLTLHFSFLNIDKHSQWMVALLDSSQDAAQIAADDIDGGNHKTDYTGYVLALNGHKKYFCLFKPVYTGEDLDSKTPEEEKMASGVRSKSGYREEHPTRKSNRARSISILQIHHKLDRLGLWMERLLEGTLPRYYITAWPEVDTIAPAK